MPARTVTDESWAEARRLYETGGLSTREIGERISTSRQNVETHLHREGWVRQNDAVKERDAEMRAKTERAKLESERRWANRRNQEADAAGITAARARASIIAALDARDDKMTRASAVAYGILIDKAQLLSGAATARIGAEDPRERAQSILDELAEKRRDREQRTG
jgi:hypothetical protein